MQGMLLFLCGTIAATTAAAAGTLQVHLAFTGNLSSMGVSWRTSKPTSFECQVQWKKQQDSSSQEKQQRQPPPVPPGITTGTTTNYTIYGGISGYYHHAEMSNLKSNERYTYRVSSEGAGWSDWYNFTSPRHETDEVTMIFTGDFGLGGAGPPAGEGLLTANAWAKLAAEGGADLIWISGDIAYPNMHGGAEFESTWNSWFDALEPSFSSLPTMVSPGNHETYLPQAPMYTAPAATSSSPSAPSTATTTGIITPPKGFLQEHDQLEVGADGTWNFTAFDHRFNMPSNGAANMWYSFDYGGVHYVAINTETDFPNAPEAFLSGWGDQLEWLEADLQAFRARSPTGWLIAMGHKPMYSSAPSYTDILQRPAGDSKHIQAAFEPLFEKYAVHFYFSGHQHGYERSLPVTNSKPTPGATTHIVAAVPGGGCGITADWIKRTPKWTVTQWPQGSPWNDHQNASGEEASLGYGVLTANATAMRWNFFLSESGALKDTVTIFK